MLEHITGKYPCLAISDGGDRSRALVVVEKGDLAKSNHVINTSVCILVDLKDLFKSNFFGKLWIIGVYFRLIDGDFDMTFCKNKVF